MSAMRAPAAATILCSVLCSGASLAQDLPGIGTAGADSTPAPIAAGRTFSPLGDLRVRGDFVRALPSGRDDLDRARSFLRFGLAATPHRAVELGVAFEAALGSDDNADNARNNDNEPSDDFNLDLAYVRWQPLSRATLWAGRHALPLQLTPLVWDDDLRPVGATVGLRRPWRQFDTWSFAAGGFEVRSLSEDDWTQLLTAQAGYSWQDGGPQGADVRAAFLHWSSIDDLVVDGLSRTNAIRNGRFVADFDLGDLALAWRLRPAGVACRLDGEIVENFGADTESAAWRAAVTLGDLWLPGHFEVRYAFHRIERDAVLAAFNSDDWWFHSRFRGHRAGIAVAAGHGLTLGVSGSAERRDDLSTWTKRLLLDLVYDFSP